MIAAGKSPARGKARDKKRVKNAETFGAWAEKWLRGYQVSDNSGTQNAARQFVRQALRATMPDYGNDNSPMT